jgi:hypothetical protein
MTLKFKVIEFLKNGFHTNVWYASLKYVTLYETSHTVHLLTDWTKNNTASLEWYGNSLFVVTQNGSTSVSH